MENVDLSVVPVDALEALRLRLSQLSHSLNTMQAHLQQSQLPSWPALQSQFNIILTQLTSLSATLAHWSETVQKIVSYPLPSFPTMTQSGLLTTLLRKKPLPDVEEWIKSGKESAKGIIIKQDEDFCAWASELVESERQEREWIGYQTRKDIDLGQTEETVKAKVEVKGWTVDQIIVYLSQGKLP